MFHKEARQQKPQAPELTQTMRGNIMSDYQKIFSPRNNFVFDTVRYLPFIPDHSRVYTSFQNLITQYLMLKIAIGHERNVEIIILHSPTYVVSSVQYPPPERPT